MKLHALVLAFVLATAGFAGEQGGSDSYGKTHGMLGDFLIGPKLTVIGAPVPFRFGLEAKWKGIVGLSFDYGFFPALTFSNVSVKLNGWNAAARFYPWKGGFYLGLGFGNQNFTGSKTDALINDTITVEMKTTFVSPQIGWRWVGDSGFFWGMELGAQIPTSTTSATTHSNTTVAATPAAALLADDVNDKANTFGNKTLPTVALLQFGYFF